MIVREEGGKKRNLCLSLSIQVLWGKMNIDFSILASGESAKKKESKFFKEFQPGRKL